jgi:pimeloyl-ACP methyl ester carboxylesterase
MVLRSYALQRQGGAQEEDVLDVASRLGEIRCPTRVVVGDLDLPEMQAIAAHVAQKVADGRLVTIRGAAHLPSLERPDELDALVLGFL